jgi:hypothetical protein
MISFEVATCELPRAATGASYQTAKKPLPQRQKRDPLRRTKLWGTGNVTAVWI